MYDDATPEQLIQAAAMTPSFLGAYQSAPASIRVGGKVYERDAARNASERVWYLAAVAMQNPRAVFVVGNQGAAEMALAFDRWEVDNDSRVVAAKERKDAADQKLEAAKTQLGQAQIDHTTAKGTRSKLERQAADAKAQIESLERSSRSVFDVKDVGQFLTLVGTGGIKAGAESIDVQVRLSNVRRALENLNAQLAATDEPEKRQAVADAREKVGEASAGVKAAQGDYDLARATVEKELRANEEKAAAEASAQAAREAAERQRQAQQEWEQQWQDYSSNAGSGGIYGDYVEPEWQSSDWATSDPSAELGETEWLDEQSDLYGDEDEALKMSQLTGEPIIGVNTRVSPYALDRYYSGYDLEQNPVFGNDNMALVTGIIAGVLAAAPAIINAVAPPPSKDSSGADANAGASKLVGEDGGQGSSGSRSGKSSSPNYVDDFLAKIGLKKTIDDAAASAGKSAGQSGGASVESTVSKYLGTGLVLAAVLFLVRR